MTANDVDVGNLTRRAINVLGTADVRQRFSLGEVIQNCLKPLLPLWGFDDFCVIYLSYANNCSSTEVLNKLMFS